MSSKNDNRGGLSVTTLVIASLSSLAAAVFVHKFWQGGAILGAALTPVIVAIVSEVLRKPVEAFSARRTAVEPPPLVAPERDDRFGVWEEQKKRPRRRLHIGLAIATGLVAFLIAAFVLTGAELVLGGASNGDKFRVIPGKQQKQDSGNDAAPATTETGETQAPEEEPPPTTTDGAPPETAPPETEPPEEEIPPAETTPLPEPQATTPAP
ncbi:MAG TPA: hypothetical protein VF529_12480 [Solirubrobacteraceae bacterium]